MLCYVYFTTTESLPFTPLLNIFVFVAFSPDNLDFVHLDPDSALTKSLLFLSMSNHRPLSLNFI